VRTSVAPTVYSVTSFGAPTAWRRAVDVGDREGRDVLVRDRHTVDLVVALRRDVYDLEVRRALNLAPRVMLDAVT